MPDSVVSWSEHSILLKVLLQFVVIACQLGLSRSSLRCHFWSCWARWLTMGRQIAQMSWRRRFASTMQTKDLAAHTSRSCTKLQSVRSRRERSTANAPRCGLWTVAWKKCTRILKLPIRLQATELFQQLNYCSLALLLRARNALSKPASQNKTSNARISSLMAFTNFSVTKCGTQEPTQLLTESSGPLRLTKRARGIFDSSEGHRHW